MSDHLIPVEPGQHNQVTQYARQAAYRKLVAMHRDEFADLLASERIRIGLPGDTFNPRSPLQGAKCGTRSGYSRHRRSGERACERCRAVEAEYQREYVRKRKGAA